MRWMTPLLALALTLPAYAAPGDKLKKRLGSDKAAKETFWELLDRTVDLEASFGFWQAYLSGGLSALTAKMDSSGSQVSEAINAVSAGEGLLRDVNFGLRVGDNEAFFSYLSDKLFEEAESQVKERVDDRFAEEAILRLMGELRPDLGKHLPDDARAYLRVQYGKMTGAIEDPWRFATRYGEPWFGGRGAEWSTEYFNVEAGLLAVSDAVSEFSRDPRKRRRRGGGTTGMFLRYSQFGRPLVLGFGNEAGTDAGGFTLQDSTLRVYALGFRFDGLSCETLCWRVIGDFIPFTGVASLDLGRFGHQRGGVFGGGGELRASLPLDLLGILFISPYAGVRADFLFPLFLEDSYNTDLDRITMWLPDYFIWGPSVGVTGRL